MPLSPPKIAFPDPIGNCAHEIDKKGKWVTINYERLNAVLAGEIDFENYPDQNDQGNYGDQNDQGTGDPENSSQKSNTRPPAARSSGPGFASRRGCNTDNAEREIPSAAGCFG